VVTFNSASLLYNRLILWKYTVHECSALP